MRTAAGPYANDLDLLRSASELFLGKKMRFAVFTVLSRSHSKQYDTDAFDASVGIFRKSCVHGLIVRTHAAYIFSTDESDELMSIRFKILDFLQLFFIF